MSLKSIRADLFFARLSFHSIHVGANPSPLHENKSRFCSKEGLPNEFYEFYHRKDEQLGYDHGNHAGNIGTALAGGTVLGTSLAKYLANIKRP